MIKIAFFDTKEYDKKLFDEYNKNYGYEITYLEITFSRSRGLIFLKTWF